MGKFSSTYYYGFPTRFTNVTVPQGATITVAYITYTAYFATFGTICNERFRGENTDNAATFSTLADYTGRSRTAAYVDWNNIGSWTGDTAYNSPSLVSIVQEIVNRPGWVSGNAMAFLPEDNNSSDSAYRDAYSYDGSTTLCPKLHIEYTVPAAPGKPVLI